MKKQIVIIFLFCLSPLLAQQKNSDEFDELMGKQTQHWIYVKKHEDFQALERYKALYEKNKNLLSLSEGKYKIPLIIHFIWLGPKAFPAQSVENIRSWMAKHPHWVVKFWTDRERPPPCGGMEVNYVEDFPFLFLKRCFEESQNYGEKSDVLRFEILYQEGGLYVDHDANCLKNFDSLHRGYDFYCGLETPHPPFAGRHITSGNGVIGARSFHPVIGRVLELIEEKWDKLGKKYRGRDGYARTQLVMERTYVMLTHAIEEKIDLEENVDIVLPAAFFFAKKNISPLYSKHFYANSWAEDGEKDEEFEKMARRAMDKISRKSQALRWIGGSAFSLNLLAFLGIFVYFIRKKRKGNKS